MYVLVPSRPCRVEINDEEKSLLKHPGKNVSWVSPGPARAPPRGRFQNNAAYRFTVLGLCLAHVGIAGGLLAARVGCGRFGPV